MKDKHACRVWVFQRFVAVRRQALWPLCQCHFHVTENTRTVATNVEREYERIIRQTWSGEGKRRKGQLS